MNAAALPVPDMSGPEYFRCERLRCTMLKQRCLDRQMQIRGARWPFTNADPFLVLILEPCAACPDGEALALAQGVTLPQRKRRPDVPDFKRCRICGERKPTRTAYWRNHSYKDGYLPDCAQCLTRLRTERKKRRATHEHQRRQAMPGM